MSQEKVPEKEVLRVLEIAREKHLIQIPPHFFDLTPELNPDRFLPFLIEVFQKIEANTELSLSFEAEDLETLVQTYPTLWGASQPRPWKTWVDTLFIDTSRNLSPHDSILADLAHLAKEGYIQSFSEAAFEERIFRLNEILRLVDRLLSRLRQEEVHMIYEDSLVLDRVVAALKGELEVRGMNPTYPQALEPGQPPSEGWKDWKISGSSTMTHTTENGKANDVFSHQFDIEIDHPWVTLSTSGTIDDQRLEDPTLDWHSGWRYKWEEGLVDFHVPYWRDYTLSVQGGNLPSLGFSEGLVASGVNVVGGRINYVSPGDIWNFDYAEGMIEDDRDRVRVGGVTYLIHPDLDVTAYALDLKGDSDKRHELDYAFATHLRYSRGALAFEYGNLEGGGEGFYTQADAEFFDSRLMVAAELRNFRNFITDFGNAPTYSGISGGDSESERGHAVSLNLSPWEWIDVNMEFDHTEDYFRENRLDNYSCELILSPLSDLEIKGEYEIEDAPSRTRISGGGISYTFPWGISTSVEFSRDDDGTENEETTRSDVTIDCEKIWPKLEGVSISGSGTRTKTFAERDEDYQYGFSWEVSDSNTLSARFTKSDTENDLWDFTWVARF